MKIAYKKQRFKASSIILIKKANEIIAEYQEQGFGLTLRQLYYQFVARDFIKNKQTEYKRLGQILNDARLAGQVDWSSIEDRTRNLRGLAHWSSPAEIVDSCASQFRVDHWEDQKFRPEVWIEKDALISVIEGVCNRFDTPFFSCRGYTSQSEVWRASMRFNGYKEAGQAPVLIHLGDHDPSGIDMTRDIRDRCETFGVDLKVNRIALNMNQVKKYSPPPNPAKMTDSRFMSYRANYGVNSWELDALEPKVIYDLIEKAIQKLIDPDVWKRSHDLQQDGRDELTKIADNM